MEWLIIIVPITFLTIQILLTLQGGIRYLNENEIGCKRSKLSSHALTAQSKV